VALLAAPASAQEGQAQPDSATAPRPSETTDLVFEREVFSYPDYDRRNPFRVLLATESGPRFEQMELRGIVYSSTPGGGVALMGIGGATQLDPQGGPGGEVVSMGSRRLRAGERWGNVRILEIRPTEVVVEVEEFGMTEQRIMPMPTRGQGGS
jgi:hypothetical protein